MRAILTYHDITYNIQDYNKAATTITVQLFDQEMQYLHDNGFRVLLLNQILLYDSVVADRLLIMLVFL